MPSLPVTAGHFDKDFAVSFTIEGNIKYPWHQTVQSIFLRGGSSIEQIEEIFSPPSWASWISLVGSWISCVLYELSVMRAFRPQVRGTGLEKEVLAALSLDRAARNPAGQQIKLPPPFPRF